VIYHWKSQWEKDSTSRPSTTEAHGAANRIFSDDQEAELLDVILSQYIGPGKQFVASTFRELAQAFYASIGGNPDELKCSDHFLDGFKSPHRLSSRRFHLRRRRRVEGRFDIEAWKEEVNTLLHLSPHRRIINCDETSWQVVPNGLLPWAPAAIDSVSVSLDAGEKDSVTVLASVTAAHDKLPLRLIAKGKTPRVEQSQLGTMGDHETDHSLSAWKTIGTVQHDVLGIHLLTEGDVIRLLAGACPGSSKG
jgi:hypothetical protein